MVVAVDSVTPLNLRPFAVYYVCQYVSMFRMIYLFCFGAHSWLSRNLCAAAAPFVSCLVLEIANVFFSKKNEHKTNKFSDVLTLIGCFLFYSLATSKKLVKSFIMNLEKDNRLSYSFISVQSSHRPAWRYRRLKRRASGLYGPWLYPAGDSVSRHR